jgi:predicted nucleic acid-binding protein
LDAEEELVVSQLVLEEVFRNINQKIPGALTAVRNLFANAPITVVENPPQKQINKNLQLADKKDLPILLSAVNYQCDFFVTGNSQDFYISEISSQLKIKIISPRRAVSLAAD